MWQRINKTGPKIWGSALCEKLYLQSKKLAHLQGLQQAIKYRNALVSTITYLVRVYSLSPECRFMAENVPIQPLNRLSLPIFHVTKSGLKKRRKKSSWRKLNIICVQHKTTEDLLQSHDFTSPVCFPSNITKDNKAEFRFLKSTLLLLNN